MSQWYHCFNNKGIPDEILSRSWDASNAVSFVFHHRSAQTVAENLPPQQKSDSIKKKRSAYISDEELYDDKENDEEVSSDTDYVP